MQNYTKNNERKNHLVGCRSDADPAVQEKDRRESKKTERIVIVFLQMVLDERVQSIFLEKQGWRADRLSGAYFATC